MSDDSTIVGEKARDEDSADSGAKVDVKRDANRKDFDRGGCVTTDFGAQDDDEPERQHDHRDDLDFDDLETNTLFYHLNTCTDSSSLRKLFDAGCGSEAARSWAYK